MDYNLDALGAQNFELMSQALAVKAIGPRLTVFGAGPDGGREATWRGPSPALGEAASWDGYGVLQAKFKERSDEPAKNLAWFRTQINRELAEWARDGSTRHEKPKYMLFSTNVRLSPHPGSGRDAINAEIRTLIRDNRLDIVDFRVWDYYDLVALLDGSEDIRRRYSAFVTAGDVIAALIDSHETESRSFGQAIAAYTARSLREEAMLNLTQSGTSGDGQVTIDKVFVDLPAVLPVQAWLDSHQDLDVDRDATADRMGNIIEEAVIQEPEEYMRAGVAAHFINDFNYLPEGRKDEKAHPHRTVLIGGPGQGKSTVTQWLAQMYRVEFLRDGPLAQTSEVRATIRSVDSRREKLQLPAIRARRWPIRIILTELADFLAFEPEASLLHYIASRVTKRSSIDVSSTMMRTWLAQYPWLVLIDGLDEVPASSNRSQVMAAIGDFFLDVASVGGDVAAVATTRPQGYGEEFSPVDYRHFLLDSLTVDEALGYADGLVAVRMGEGSENADKVVDRLRRASREEHTRKLFESPLQVTILEVLLEKLGKPPGDRSRLYSAYYKVISEREQEKSGPLSDLLQKYESDVDFLHRTVGFTLQERGSEVGETTSSMSTTEFQQIIEQRFRDNGHSEPDVRTLADEFAVLVTDRLVFLAKLQADRIGFELRSLQEFMASEHIVNLPESSVVSEILLRGASPYWRNVVLFAVGSIFAHREHLRAELVLMCARMNEDQEGNKVLLPGSELALEILRDGSCISMPIYSEGLARIALRLMEFSTADRIPNLLLLTRTDLGMLLWREAESSAPTTATGWLNRARLLSLLHEEDRARAASSLQRLVTNASDSLKTDLTVDCWENGDSIIGFALEDYFAVCDPRDLMARRSGRVGVRRRGEREVLPDWMTNLSLLFDPSIESGPDQSVLFATYTALGLHSAEWSWVRTIPERSAWLGLKLAAEFAIDPSPETLAAAMDSSGTGFREIAPGRLPWPLEACLRQARRHAHETDDDGFESAMTGLAAAARSGQLGTATDWFAAQARWGDYVVVDERFLGAASADEGAMPIWPGLAEDGVPLGALIFTSKGIDLDEEPSRDELQRVLSMLLDRVPVEDTWVQLSGFVLSVASTEISFLGKSSAERSIFSKLIDTLAARLSAVPVSAQWVSWLGIDGVSSDRPSDETLRNVGIARQLSGHLDQDTGRAIFDRGLALSDGLPIVRLALAMRPEVLGELSASQVGQVIQGKDPVCAGVLVQAHRVLRRSSGAVWDGESDADLLDISAARSSIFGSGWFTRLLEMRSDDFARDVATRTAWLTADLDPSASGAWIELARRLSRSFNGR